MKRKFNVLGILLAASLSLSACTEAELPRPELINPVNATMDSATVEYRQLISLNQYDGKVLPAVKELSFDTDGYLYGLFVSPGDMVGEGDVIATIVGKNYNKLKSIEDEITEFKEEMQTNITYLEAELELTKLSGADSSELELNLKHTKELNQLHLDKLEKEKEELSKGDTGLKYIEAPYDCYILSTASVRAGSFVSAGLPLAAIEAEGDCTVTCEFLNERTVSNLESYYAVINGKEYSLEYIPYTKQEMKDYSAKNIVPDSKFRLVDADENVTVGDYAKVITISDRIDHVLSVPIDAVMHDASGHFVYEIVDGVRVKRNVTTGVSDSMYIEILEGLSEGGYVYVKN